MQGWERRYVRTPGRRCTSGSSGPEPWGAGATRANTERGQDDNWDVFSRFFFCKCITRYVFFLMRYGWDMIWHWWSWYDNWYDRALIWRLFFIATLADICSFHCEAAQRILQQLGEAGDKVETPRKITGQKTTFHTFSVVTLLDADASHGLILGGHQGTKFCTGLTEVFWVGKNRWVCYRVDTEVSWNLKTCAPQRQTQNLPAVQNHTALSVSPRVGVPNSRYMIHVCMDLKAISLLCVEICPLWIHLLV